MGNIHSDDVEIAVGAVGAVIVQELRNLEEEEEESRTPKTSPGRGKGEDCTCTLCG